MARRNRAMSDRGRSNALAPTFDTVQKISGVATGCIGFPRSTIETGLKPPGVGCPNLAAVNPKPAVRSGPLRSQLQFRRNGELHAAGILAMDVEIDRTVINLG